MRINELRFKPGEVSFDDFICTPDGGVDFHPYLTTHLSGQDWTKLYEGVAFANRLGTVLNVHVTINWDCAGIAGDDQVSRALVQWTGELRKWCGARRYSCHYVYVHERAREQGLHTHLLTAIPRANKEEFQRWAFRYLQRMAGRRPLPINAVCVRYRRERDVERQWLWFSYLTKGLDPSLFVGDVHDRNRWHPVSQLTTWHLRRTGVVRCRFRAGVSRNIDAHARQRYGGGVGFQSRYLDGATTPAELFVDDYVRQYEEGQRQAAMETERARLLPPNFSLRW